MAFIYVRVPITSFLSSSYTPELYQLFRLESIASEAITIFLILLATSGIFKQAIYFQFYLHYFMSEEEKRAILVMSWWKLWLLVKENDTTYLVNCATIKRLISASIWRSRDMRDTEPGKKYRDKYLEEAEGFAMEEFRKHLWTWNFKRWHDIIECIIERLVRLGAFGASLGGP